MTKTFDLDQDDRNRDWLRTVVKTKKTTKKDSKTPPPPKK